MATAGIFATESDVLGRFVQIGVAGQKVISLSFPSSPEPGSEDEHAVLRQILQYLGGDAVDFKAVEIGLTVPTVQRAVLQRTRSIPYGEEITVERLTRMTPDLDPDTEQDRNQVRTALSENPIPLIVPDHRVRDGPSGAPSEVEAKLRDIEGL